MCIIDYIVDWDLVVSLMLILQYVMYWLSGIKIGDCLKDFNDNYVKCYFNGNIIILIFSDGFDIGELVVLVEVI